MECVGSLQCNVCCDRNLSCAECKQPIIGGDYCCHGQLTNGVLFRLSHNLSHFLKDCLHILHILYICLHLPGIERTNMELR